ncbi:COQ9 family protein [Sphingomonas sp.]|uniref:COQ9 family protein n=1 Tax=Sphingomonas sp. TaxID=28214 RepID=UPI001B1EDAFD|nr:COQ9 family protein [Sphingomonas sp.]MBO9714132.1 COQ9 family protein [Sphingomonas sp.]
MALPPDPTLDEIRAALAAPVAANAAFDGWNARAVDAAADSMGLDRGIAGLAFETPLAMIDAWFAWIDAAMAERLPAERLATMKIRERITALVETRLELLAPNREALRRAATILAMPQNAAHAVRLGWRAADAMWRLAGDTATDYNHYTKRTILAGVYAATLAVYLQDDSDGWAETRAFLGRRIDGIMRFEKAKAQLLGRGKHKPSLSRFIGRLRYPVV